MRKLGLALKTEAFGARAHREARLVWAHAVLDTPKYLPPPGTEEGLPRYARCLPESVLTGTRQRAHYLPVRVDSGKQGADSGKPSSVW